MSNILVIEDEAVIRSALKRLLERHGYQVEAVGSVTKAQEFQVDNFDLVITDLRLPGPPGTDIIPLAKEIPVLIMTSYASVKSAVESMKMGAADYIAKPFDHDEMVMTVEKLLKQNRISRKAQALSSDMEQTYPVSGMVGNCPAMQAVGERIRKVAPTSTTVLILGESGTGKELVARALHEHSLRSDGPIITVNCAAIPENLIESELFGHEKGAFTGAMETRQGLVEAADEGTLFLDEIGELSPPAQARLLRVLQEGEIRRVGANNDRKVDIRLIAATHRDLQQLVREERFRDDLYFRLRVMEIRLPPLREREEDIIALAQYMLERNCKRLNRHCATLSEEALEAIRAYAWPGNVRELENALERAVILCEGETIGPDLLALDVQTRQEPVATPAPTTSVESGLSLEEYFVQFVKENEEQMTETELAKRLGISRKALWERRNRFGIPRKKSSKTGS